MKEKGSEKDEGKGFHPLKKAVSVVRLFLQYHRYMTCLHLSNIVLLFYEFYTASNILFAFVQLGSRISETKLQKTMRLKY